MADRKITALTELTAPVATDVFPIIDVSESANANKNKKIQLTTILRGSPNGRASAPSVGCIDDTGTSGLFRVTDDEIGISCNQTQIASFAAAGLKLGSGTIAAQLHLFSTDTTDQVIIENTDAGADTAPDLVLFRNSASPADNDNLGNLIFRGKDDNSDSVEYASIVAQIADATNSSEDGILDLMSTAAGTLASRIRLKSEFVGIHEADPTFPLHLATADTTSGFCIESSLDSAASSADILLFHRRGSDGAGQDNDLLSSISFQGKNDAGTPEEVIYATLETKIIDASDASEDGQINLKSMVAGTLTTVLTVDSNGATVVGNVVVSGLVDGVDIAARDTLFGGLTSSSGVLTNGVTATTQSASDNSTKVATTAYTDTAISNLVDSSPSTLNTLNELAAALGDDANFSTTVTNSIATKMPLAGGTFTGDVTFTGDQDNLTISSDNPKLIFDQTSSNVKYKIEEGSGLLQLKISQNSGVSYASAISIGGVGNIFIPDNDKVNFGSGNDLVIVHDGSDSKITNKTGNLLIEAKDSETGIKVIPDGSVELYHDNVLRCETSADGLNLPDNSKLQLGTGQDLQVYWDGSAGFVTNQGGGNLHFNSDTVLIKNAANTKSYIRAYNNSSVELYFDNVKRCETSLTGLDVTGTLKAINKVVIHDNGTSTPMLQLTNSVTGTGTEDGFRIGYSTNSNVAFFIAGESNSAFQIKTGGSAANDERLNISNTGVFTVKSNSENMLVATPNAGVDLYHDNVLRCATSADGITVTDRVTCAAITISDGQPSIIFEDTGANPDFILQNRDGTFAIRDFTSNVNRFLVNMANGEVTTTGSILPDADNTDALGSSSKRFTTLHSAALNTGDINMSNLNDNGNEVDGSKGSWTLQEGADDLFIINRVSGKKYKFNLTEII